ncbi:MAG: hypothetical protein AAGC77_13670 [Pseudomonadota bacterium]
MVRYIEVGAAKQRLPLETTGDLGVRVGVFEVQPTGIDRCCDRHWSVRARRPSFRRRRGVIGPMSCQGGTLTPKR